jgi:hypothetical protein
MHRLRMKHVLRTVHMIRIKQLFTHDTGLRYPGFTQDLRVYELYLRKIRIIAPFTLTTWFTHGTLDTH